MYSIIYNSCLKQEQKAERQDHYLKKMSWENNFNNAMLFVVCQVSFIFYLLFIFLALFVVVARSGPKFDPDLSWLFLSVMAMVDVTSLRKHFLSKELNKNNMFTET